MGPLPYDVQAAMVQCFGKAFHYKDGVAAFLAAAEVPRTLIDKYRNEPKFVWARRLLAELGDSDDGCALQRKILRALYDLRTLPDSKIDDKDGGLDSLRNLKALVRERQLVVEADNASGNERASAAEQHKRLVEDRARKLDSLKKIFADATVSPDRQASGYSLQRLLQELFTLHEIDYRRPFRNLDNTHEVDGHFYFLSVDYLVEAKWTSLRPTESDIAAFKHKVESKLAGTRGLFVSVMGFRKEVVEKFNEHGTSIIFMDGLDLTHVLEGRVDLRDGLRRKIEAAAQKGLVSTPIFP